ncbi:MAG: hypothetical protein POELPBGB_03434 [Bacteroidia bacterium]|nr:hypothetical protein [Bacteroidia bacterium]
MKNLLLVVLYFICCSSFGQVLPDFKFSLADNSTFTKENLAKEKPVVVFYFDPFCDGCIKQAKQLSSQLTKFNSVNLVWVSTESDWKLLNEFKNNWFKTASNVFVCSDTQFKFDVWFGYSEFPAVYAYNSNWQRTAKFSTELNIDELLKALK